MATMNFSVPDDVKEAFNTTFEGRNKRAVIAPLMRDAVVREQRRQRHRGAVERILAARSEAPGVTLGQFEAARDEGRALGHMAWLPDANPGQAE